MNEKLTNYLENESEPFLEDGRMNHDIEVSTPDCTIDQQECSYEKLKENDDSNRKLKLLRFANDYCRSSPNMQLKDRHSLLELGWRPCKSEYLIDYELFDYVIGEQRQVSYFFKIFSLNQS